MGIGSPGEGRPRPKAAAACTPRLGHVLCKATSLLSTVPPARRSPERGRFAFPAGKVRRAPRRSMRAGPAGQDALNSPPHSPVPEADAFYTARFSGKAARFSQQKAAAPVLKTGAARLPVFCFIRLFWGWAFDLHLPWVQRAATEAAWFLYDK